MNLKTFILKSESWFIQRLMGTLLSKLGHLLLITMFLLFPIVQAVADYNYFYNAGTGPDDFYYYVGTVPPPPYPGTAWYDIGTIFPGHVYYQTASIASSPWYYAGAYNVNEHAVLLATYSGGAGSSIGGHYFIAYPGGPGMDDNSDGGSCKNGCSQCMGMVQWQVSEPYISLWLQDEPLGYQPAAGPRISFELSFKESDYFNGYNLQIFGVGKRWNCSWYSYVTRDVNSNFVVFCPGGRQRTFYTTNDYLTNTRLTGDFTNGFTLLYPDGSQDVYGFIATNGIVPQMFLTQRSNPQGQRTTLTYYAFNPANPVVRLRYVIDGDGRTNLIYYATNNTFSTNLISKVVDPYGRMAALQYDATGHVTNIIDSVTNFSAITYSSNDLPASITTAYGTTSFTLANTFGFNNTPQSGRSILIDQPDGGCQLYLYTNNAPGIVSSYPTNQVPNTSPFTNTFDNSDLELRDTFYWGPRQYANLSTTNISAFTTNDFRLARMQHWLTSTNSYVGNTLSMERDPSPDSAGNIEGQKTWYDYSGKTNNEYEGVQVQPLYVAQVLPDGTTRFTRSLRNSIGAVTNETTTYNTGY